MNIPRWVWEWTIILAFLTQVTFLIGWQMADDRPFSGVNINAPDTYHYIGIMRQGKEGSWLFHSPYNYEGASPTLIFFPYILFGKLSALTGLSLVLVFHVMRLMVVFLFGPTVYQFVRRYLDGENAQKLALGLIFFTGGWGWLSVLAVKPGEIYPPELVPDLWFSNGISFLSLYSSIHMGLNVTLLLWFWLITEQFIRTGRIRDGAWASVIGCGFTLIHPYPLIITGLTFGLYLLWQKSPFINYFRLGAVHAPPILLGGLMLFSVQQDIAISQSADLGRLIDLPFISLMILYGGLWILGFIGLLRFTSDRFLLWAWFLISVILVVLSPSDLRGRFLQGFQIPLAVLGTIAWFEVIRPKLNPRIANFIIGSLVVSLALSSIFLLTSQIAHLLDRENPDLYIPADEQAATDWLKANAEADSVIFSALETGNRLVSRVKGRYLLGHSGLGSNFEDRERDLVAFYNPETSDEERQALLERLQVTYIYYSETEKKVGGFDPTQAPYLDVVFEQGEVVILVVNQISS